MQILKELLFAHSIGDYLTALLVFGGGPVAISYGIFRYLTKKWIESKFAAQLEFERHEHSKELQELKKKLDSQLSRAIKVQDREFEVLRDAWDYLQDAESHASALLSTVQSHPDLSKLNAARFNEFLANSRLSSAHQTEVRDAPDPTDHYRKLIFWYDLHDAKQAYVKYRSHVTKNTIFLRTELCILFEKMSSVIWDGLISREIGEESHDVKFWIEASRKMRDNLNPLKEELQEAVRQILWGAERDVP